MNKNLFVVFLLGLLCNTTYATTYTSSRTHTETATSTVREGVLVLTVYQDVYEGTTLVNTMEPSALTRVSATSASPITTAATSDVVTSSSSSTRTTPVVSLSSASTTTSVVFSTTGELSTSLTGSSVSSVSQDSSRNPLITSSIVVSTSNSASINTSTLSSSVTISSPTTTVSASSTSSTSTTSRRATTSTTSSSSSLTSAIPVATATSYSGNLFAAIDTNEPPSIFPRQELYLDAAPNVDNGDTPYQTNKFYTNLMLDDQSMSAYVYPYTLWYLHNNQYGMAVGHTTSSQYVFGTHEWVQDGYGYYFNPVQIAQLVFSATSFDSSVSFALTEMEQFSALATLSTSSDDYMEVPMVEGMGFSTAIYHGDLRVRLNSGMAVLSLTKEESRNLATGILKYRVSLNNGVDWLIYVTLPEGYTSDDFSLQATNSVITGSTAIDGLVIQVAVAPGSDSSEVFYDQAAGMYAVSATLSGSVVDSSVAEYAITYETRGASLSGDIIVFLLPHHVDSLSSSFAGAACGFYLDSTTKGRMYAYLATQVIMSEILETDLQFLPWTPGMGDLSYSPEQLIAIAAAANSELSVDIRSTVAGVNSNYYSGKVIDKYAYILLTVSEIVGDDEVTLTTLDALKEAFEDFFNNEQFYPFMYDTKFKGITSQASQITHDAGVDFGSSLYNDHHFHYGYFVHAAAVVGYVDAKYNGTWAQDNKDWINSLIRDVANPSTEDSHFPVSRMFNWFHGHSWAAGLQAGGDGKNQESSSEDYNFAYGMKLWGRVIGDHSMESRGDLMLAVSRRSMNMYYLYRDNNEVEPSEIVSNKVAGILFDNKIDYTTYFGSNIEYIHGIHMLPITPASSLIRESAFVSEEWSEKLSPIVDSLNSGWAGILRLNQALINPASSYSFFSSPDFSNNYLDNGQSLTWCLAFSAGVSIAS